MDYITENKNYTQWDVIIMITQADLKAMEDDIIDVIPEFNTTITIKRQSAIQPEYNSLMRESIGEVEYDTTVVPAIVKDSPSHDLQTSAVGDKYNGERIIRIPVRYKDNGNLVDTDILATDIIGFTDDMDAWRISTMKRRIGEIIVRCKRVGD